MSSNIALDDLKISQLEKGKKSFEYYRIGETPLLPIHLPVGVVRGEKDGPTVCVVAGEHPCEYPGIDAAIRIFNEITPEKLRGTLIVVPVVNVVGFDRATPYVCPLDNLNMAFQYPGDKTGTFSKVNAYYLEKVVQQANYFITLHGGEATELLIPYGIYFRTGVDKVDRESKAMMVAFDIEYNEERGAQGYSSGQVSISLESGALFIEAPKAGIPAMVAEVGSGWGACDERDVTAQVKGVMNVLKHLKMIDGSPVVEFPEKKVFNDVAELRVTRGGLYYPTVKLKDPVKQGQAIAYVKNIRGEIVETIKTPTDGFVQLYVPKHVVNTGDMVFLIGKNLHQFK